MTELEHPLPCIACGVALDQAFPDNPTQPFAGTEFRTYGHYGSTFWDSFDGEELVVNICDPCLRAHTDRIAQQKRYRPIRCGGMVGFGRQWVEKPMHPYTGIPDAEFLPLEPEQLGSKMADVEWSEWIDEQREDALKRAGRG